MFSYIPHELALLKELLSYRVEALNPFFIFLNHLDSAPFYMLIATLVFTGLNSRTGLRFILLIAITYFTNYFLKELLMQPRPITLDPSLGLVETTSQFGLPSGAAQAAMSFAVFLTYYYPNKIFKRFATFYVVLASFTRVYIGMHFISDVIIGCLIGFALTHLYLKIIPKLEQGVQYLLNPFGWLGIVFMFIGLYWVSAPAAYVTSGAVVCGTLMAEMLRRLYPPKDMTTIQSRLLNIVLGIFILIGVSYLKSILAGNLKGIILSVMPVALLFIYYRPTLKVHSCII